MDLTHFESIDEKPLCGVPAEDSYSTNWMDIVDCPTCREMLRANNG